MFFRSLAWCGPVLGLVSACTGALLEPAGPGTWQGTDGVQADEDAGPGADPSGPAANCQASPLRARILSLRQYQNTLTDLLGLSPADLSSLSGIAGPVLDEVAVDDLTAEQLANAADQVAVLASQRLDTLHLCGWDRKDADATPLGCSPERLIDSLGSRAYRRPLSADERSALGAVFDAGRAEGSDQVAVEWLLSALLQSPDFLYRLSTASDDAGDVALSDFELASRLSYFLWDSMPDAELYEAARSGHLHDAKVLAEQVERMQADGKRSRTLHAFYSHFLGLDRFRELARDDASFDDEVIASLEASVYAGLDALYAGKEPSAELLFSGSDYYFDAVLGKFYGVDVSGSDFTRVDLSKQGRHGIVNHPAFLSIVARPAETDPIGRGVFVLRNLLCTDLAPPENVEIPELPPVGSGTMRERLEQHTKSKVCQSCHGMIDPVGLAFEGFDQLGKTRDKEDGKPVDTSAAVKLGTDLDGNYKQGKELFAKLGDSHDVRKCFARRFYEFGMARAVAPPDACALGELSQRFESAGNLRTLLSDIATSEAFVMRKREGNR